MTERVLIIDNLRTMGVKVGGRFDGWLVRKHPDGQWVSVRKLESVDPFEGDPMAELLKQTVVPIRPTSDQK